MSSNIKKWYSLDQAMREKIAEADPVGFLCDIAQGKAFRAAPTPGRVLTCSRASEMASVRIR